jgi:poly(A) polymerase
MPAPRDPVRIFRLLLGHPAIRVLTEAARAEGVEAHLVGGILRDRFLGLPSHDLDAMVSGRGRAVAEAVARRLEARLVPLGGREFGAYRLVVHPTGGRSGRGSDPGSGPGTLAGGYVLDLWDREGAALDADLARRDFTVNSIALSTPKGELYDPFDGFADLRHRILRATTEEAFAGDPLRVLRLPRLLVQLPGFSADPPTLGLARAAAPDLATVASERVREELALLFSRPDPRRAVAVLEALELYPGLWLGHPGEPPRGPGRERTGAGTVCAALGRLAPCALELRRLAGGRLPFPIHHRLARLALTFAGLPEVSGLAPETGVEDALARFARAGYLTRRDAADVRALLGLLPQWSRLELDAGDDGAARRRFLHDAGALWPTAACGAGARTGAAPGARAAWTEAARAVIRLDRREGETLRDPPRLLDGREIGEILGIEPGPRIGRAVEALRRAQVEGGVRTEEDARRLVRTLGIT